MPAFSQLSFTRKQIEASGVHADSQGLSQPLMGLDHVLTLVTCLYCWAHLQLAPKIVHLHPASQTPFTSLHCYACTHAKTLQWAGVNTPEAP